VVERLLDAVGCAADGEAALGGASDVVAGWVAGELGEGAGSTAAGADAVVAALFSEALMASWLPPHPARPASRTVAATIPLMAVVRPLTPLIFKDT
jgi:hypothetical protein